MAAITGVFLRVFATCLRIIQFLVSILVLGVYSYFLAKLHHNDLVIMRWIKAVEGLSGAAALYGIFCILLTLCLGGISFFALLAIILDIAFIGAYVAIAWYNRDGTENCSGFVHTPLGNGPSNAKEPGYGNNGFGFGNLDGKYTPDLKRACTLEKAVFILAIINCFLFAFTAIFQMLLARHHQREKRYGPSPANNYTSGFGRRPMWRRNRRNRDAAIVEKDAHVRHSHEAGGVTGGTYPPTGTAVNY